MPIVALPLYLLFFDVEQVFWRLFGMSTDIHIFLKKCLDISSDKVAGPLSYIGALCDIYSDMLYGHSV